MGELIILRHGETAWSRARRHTGRTDLPLTERGEEQARAVAPLLARRPIGWTVCSPAVRARRTAELAGLAVDALDPDLWEWDYGGYEGMTSADIRRGRPGWYLWDDGVVPGDAEHPGESIEQVGKRADAVLDRIGARLARHPAEDVAVIAHAHVLRILTACRLRLNPTAGRLFALGTATVSTLGTEHGRPVISSWNVPA